MGAKLKHTFTHEISRPRNPNLDCMSFPKKKKLKIAQNLVRYELAKHANAH